MAVPRKYQGDVDAILTRRHDNGGDHLPILADRYRRVIRTSQVTAEGSRGRAR